MAQPDILREFLVSLGFKTDEKSLKRFTDGVESATKGVAKLVAAISGAALTVGAGVAAFASNLEALYFAAQKTGASAGNLKAFERAMQGFGVAAGESLQSVQSLARFMRNTPGAEGFLRSLGVEARDANGNLKDTTDIMVGLGKALQSKPYYLAKQYGDLLGISEDTLRAMLSGDFEKQLEKQRARMKDSGFEKAAADAHKFMENLRELQTYLEAFGLKVQDALMKKLGGSMESFAEWFRVNGPMIAQRTADILVALLTLAEKLGPALVWLAEKFIALDSATDGWSTKLIALAVVLKMIGGFAIIGGIISLATAFGKLGAGIASAASAGGGILGKLMSFGARALGGLGLLLHSGELNSGEDAWAANRRKSLGIVDNPVAFFQGLGWSKEQAAGIVANLKAESNLNAKAVGDGGKAYGIAQWHPDRQENFKKWAGKDIRESTQAEQMAFVHYELTQGAERKAGDLLRASKNAAQAGEVVSRYYERPAAADAEAAKRAKAAVQIAQQTTINVNGGDAAATGRAVAGEQERVNQTLTRNMQLAYE